MVLMDDDFASIVNGVEEGRKIFDNLKKTIVYILASNISQILPYVAYILFGIPLPLSSLQVLFICVGTDILPAISFAYEKAEIDIMTRSPRKSTDHLVSIRLITHAYLLHGWVLCSCAFFNYFTVLYGMGFAPFTVFQMQFQNYANFPVEPTEFRPNAPDLGNPMLTGENGSALNPYPYIWGGTGDQFFDMRYIYVNYDETTKSFKPAFGEWNTPDHGQSMCQFTLMDSELTGAGQLTNPCFKIEAIYFAQSAYFVGVVIGQWTNVFACKQRKMSLLYSPFNMVSIYGILSETILVIIFTYIPGIGPAVGGRILPIYFVFACLPFSMLLMFWEETRKLLIRQVKSSNPQYLGFFESNSLW